MSLGRKVRFFSPSGFEIQSDFDYRTSKIKFYSVRSLKCYLNEKNLIHGRVTATISKFSPQIFETYITYEVNSNKHNSSQAVARSESNQMVTVGDFDFE